MSKTLDASIPALRRYGALLIGSKDRADDHLEHVLAGAVASSRNGDDLYRLFHEASLPTADLKLTDFAETDHRTLRALHKLSPADRALLLLTGMAGLDHRQVASIVGDANVDIRFKLRRAQALMRASYRNRLCVIVEDDLIAMRDLEAELIQTDLGVAGTAKSRDEAFGLTDTLRPDIAFIDLALPEGAQAGAEVAERLRRLFNVRIVFVTAFAKIASELAQAGDMIVPKPWSTGSLKRVISTATA